jgi:hypothetical protein
MFRICLTFFSLVCLLAACDGSEFGEPLSDSESPLREDEGPEEHSDEENGISTMDEYIEAYCDYAVGCALWVDLSACVDDLDETALPGCEVVSVVDLNACVDWLASLTCADQGWIDACDNAFTCN